MKKWILMGVFGCVAFPAMAQFVGLPIANSAAVPATGETAVSTGVVLGDDYNLYGGRISFAPVRRLALFVDLGALDPDGGDWGSAFQGGIHFALPLGDESPVDVAARAIWGHASYDAKPGDVKMSGFNLGAHVSRTLDFLAPYVFLGLNFIDSEIKVSGEKSSDDEIDLAAAAGVLLSFGENFSLYLEIAHVDEFMTGMGARWRF